MPFYTQKQIEDAVKSLLPADRQLANLPNYFKEKVEIMWKMSQSFGAEPICWLASSLVYGFYGTPVGVIRAETYTAKDHSRETRFLVTSPWIKKSRGTRDAVKSKTPKGVVSRLSSDEITPYPLHRLFGMSRLMPIINSIGSTSVALKDIDFGGFPDNYAFLFDNVDTQTGMLNEPLPENIIAWIRKSKEKIVRTQNKAAETWTVRKSFLDGFYLFVTHDHMAVPKILMMQYKYTDVIKGTVECVNHRWIDSFNDIATECPHVLGLHNLIRLNRSETESGLIYAGSLDNSVFSSQSYSPTYGVIRGTIPTPMGFWRGTVVPVTPISNDTEPKQPETPVAVTAPRLSDLFGV